MKQLKHLIIFRHENQLNHSKKCIYLILTRRGKDAEIKLLFILQRSFACCIGIFYE